MEVADKPFLLFISYGTLLSIYVALEAGYESYRFLQAPGDFMATATAPARYPNGSLACPEGRTCTEDQTLEDHSSGSDLPVSHPVERCSQ